MDPLAVVLQKLNEAHGRAQEFKTYEMTCLVIKHYTISPVNYVCTIISTISIGIAFKNTFVVITKPVSVEIT